MLVRVRAGTLFSHTVQWNKETDGALRDPLADSITGAFLYTSDQGSVINYAVENLTFWRFECAHNSSIGTGPGRIRAAAHDG